MRWREGKDSIGQIASLHWREPTQGIGEGQEDCRRARTDGELIGKDKEPLPCHILVKADDRDFLGVLERAFYWAFGGPLVLLNREIPTSPVDVERYRHALPATQALVNHLILPSSLPKIIYVGANLKDVTLPLSDLGLTALDVTRRGDPDENRRATFEKWVADIKGGNKAPSLWYIGSQQCWLEMMPVLPLIERKLTVIGAGETQEYSTYQAF